MKFPTCLWLASSPVRGRYEWNSFRIYRSVFTSVTTADLVGNVNVWFGMNTMHVLGSVIICNSLTEPSEILAVSTLVSDWKVRLFLLECLRSCRRYKSYIVNSQFQVLLTCFSLDKLIQSESVQRETGKQGALREGARSRQIWKLQTWVGAAKRWGW